MMMMMMKMMIKGMKTLSELIEEAFTSAVGPVGEWVSLLPSYGGDILQYIQIYTIYYSTIYSSGDILQSYSLPIVAGGSVTRDSPRQTQGSRMSEPIWQKVTDQAKSHLQNFNTLVLGPNQLFILFGILNWPIWQEQGVSAVSINRVIAIEAQRSICSEHELGDKK